MSAFDEFISQYPAGSKIDTDGFPAGQPFQCFDAVLVYMRKVAKNNGLYISCRSSGFVKDWWNDFDSNGLSKYFDRIPWNQKGQRGDVAIWGVAPATPYSHVAIILEDKGDNQYIYGQNQPHPYTTQINFTSKALLGYLRPKGGNNVATTIPDADNYYGRYGIDLAQRVRGRILTRAEFKKYIVGNTDLRAVEILCDDSEANNWLALGNLGRTAKNDGWADQIYGLLAKKTALEKQILDVQNTLAVSRNDDSIDKSTIESQRTTITELQSNLKLVTDQLVKYETPIATPKIDTPVETKTETGDAGIKAIPPVQYSTWASLGERIKIMFK